MFETLCRETFGPNGRYTLQTIRDRFGNTAYLVTDAETLDWLDLPAIIRQEYSREKALRGLPS